MPHLSQKPYVIQTLDENPALRDEIVPLLRAGWTRFLLEDPVSFPLWEPLLKTFPEFCFGILEKDSGRLMAAGLTVPLAWDGEYSELMNYGWHWVLRQSLEDFRFQRTPRTLSAANAVVHPDFRGRGLADALVHEMKEIAQTHGFQRYIAPLRPTLKEKYPLAPIERYMNWTRPDGLPFDPWLRVQKRLGAKILGPALRSIHIEAPLSRWCDWTGLFFPDSGPYIIPGGSVPLLADTVRNLGTYTAPSVWIAHEIGDSREF